MTNRVFLSFWAIFCPLTLLTTWKIKVMKKMKKMTEVKILSFHICITEMNKADKIFCHFRLFFAPQWLVVGGGSKIMAGCGSWWLVMGCHTI